MSNVDDKSLKIRYKSGHLSAEMFARQSWLIFEECLLLTDQLHFWTGYAVVGTLISGTLTSCSSCRR